MAFEIQAKKANTFTNILISERKEDENDEKQPITIYKTSTYFIFDCNQL